MRDYPTLHLTLGLEEKNGKNMSIGHRITQLLITVNMSITQVK
jgi:hypothetical protein